VCGRGKGKENEEVVDKEKKKKIYELVAVKKKEGGKRRRRIGKGIFQEVSMDPGASLGPATLYPSRSSQAPTPETALRLTTPLHTPCRTPLKRRKGIRKRLETEDIDGHKNNATFWPDTFLPTKYARSFWDM
jgi:hypothetical protein